MRKFIFFFLLPFLLFAAKPKVYDCFMFFNELEILEIRLNELYPYVDKFVLVESCETHRRAEPKPFYFEMYKERFAPFLDKIIHIKLNEHIETDDPWVRENWQRNQIMRGLSGCAPNDIILISDVDEIVPAVIIPQLSHALTYHRHAVCFQQMYVWFLNRSRRCVWPGTGIVRYRNLVHLTPQGVRNLVRKNGLAKKWHTGWHFTSMGGYEKIVEKYHGIVEGYDTVISKQEWRRQVNCHLLVPIDNSFPKFVQDNIEYLIEKNLIDTDPTQT